MAKMFIIGGGIGGLSAAYSLQQIGHDVTVYEGTPTHQFSGAGLGVGPNALNVLDKLGLKKQIMEHSNILHKMIFYTDKGKCLTETDTLMIRNRLGTENITVHRSNLLLVLRNSLKPGTIVLNKRCVDFKQESHSVTVSFEDGDTARADAIVAADGVNSIFRRKLVPGSIPRYAGYTCWRAVISNPGIAFNDFAATETWGTSGRFGIVPLAGSQIYWYACINAKARDPQVEKYGVNDLLTIFRNYHEPIPQIIQATDDESLIHNDIVDIKPLQQYAFGRIVLLGDAAHAMTPNLGQGAGQALEDAYVLAKCLVVTNDVSSAFKVYETRRLDRTRKIIKLSDQIGKIAQLENKGLIRLRNAVLRQIPPSVGMKQFKFLYDVDLN